MTEEEKRAIIELAKDLQKEVEEKEIKSKAHKKKLKFGKKILLMAFGLCFSLIAFTMLMIYQQKDSMTLSVLATAGVGCLPIMYGIYTNSATKISLEHMEKNYIENYDEKNNVY